MKRTLVGLSAMALVCAMTVASADGAKATKCTYHNFWTSFDDAGPVDVDGFPENFCYRFATKGTIKGNYISCIVPDPDGEEFVLGPPSRASIFALGPWTHEVEGLGEVSDAYSIYWDEWIETREGTVHLHSYGVSDIWGTGSQVTLGKVVPDGTGKFAGASGELFSTVDSGGVRITGTICTQ